MVKLTLHKSRSECLQNRYLFILIEFGRAPVLYVCSTSLHKPLLILQGLYVMYVVQIVFSGTGSLDLPSCLTSLFSSLKVFFLISLKIFCAILLFSIGDSCFYGVAQLVTIPGTSHEQLFQNNSVCGHLEQQLHCYSKV